MSVLKLFYSTTSNPWKLTANKLFKIDNIASYLSTKDSVVINNFQYQKNALEMSIKVALPQSQSQPLSITGYKYASINDGSRINYYYIKKATWRSTNTIQFDLVMDVLNTLVENQDYRFKKNTRIIREHKPRVYTINRTPRRIKINYYLVHGQGDYMDGEQCSITDDRGTLLFTCQCIQQDQDQDYSIVEVDEAYDLADAIQSLEDTIGSANVLMTSLDNPGSEIEFEVNSVENVKSLLVYRKIDYINENINPMLNCKNAVGIEVQDKSPLNQNWYLLYRNQLDPSDVLTNPVDCYLIPENDTPTAYGMIADGRLIPSYLEEGATYFFRVRNNVTFTLSNGVVVPYNSAYQDFFAVSKCGNKLSCVVYRAFISAGTSSLSVLWLYDDIDYVSISPVPCNYDVVDSDDGVTWGRLQSLTFPYIFNNNQTDVVIDGINKLDRTSAKNIKLIKLPYCPFAFTSTNGRIDVNANWELKSIDQTGGGGVIRELRLTDLSVKLSHTLPETLGINPYSKFYVATSQLLNISINRLRLEDDGLESKMLHSEFYQPKLIYDSFTFTFELEKLDENFYYEEANRKLEIIFTMTRTINSKFLFMPKDITYKLADSNYPSVMAIARNNEEVLYNVPYINYIRTGFNYDVKAKNMSNASNWIGLGLSVASVGLSLLAPSVPLKVAGVVASFVSMASSIKNTIVTTIQNEEGLKQKVLQSQNQTASVSGSDDVDLMSEYSNNRLKYLIYEPNDNMKNLLKDLFYYAGYNSGRMGLPNHNTRVNFDYLECDASFIDEGRNIPEEIIAELKNCFKAGVTYIHETSRTTNKWDIDQIYENWEIELL